MYILHVINYSYFCWFPDWKILLDTFLTFPSFLLDFTSSLCLKDLSEAVTGELKGRLTSEPAVFQRFLQLFGLDPAKNLDPEKLCEFFPHTPVRLLRDVFKELQLFDLVDLLDKVKWRTLRPAFSLEEMRKLLITNKRPTKFYSKAEILIIECSHSVAVDDTDVERIGSFFKHLNSQSQVTKVTAKVPEQLSHEALTLWRFQKAMEDDKEQRAKEKETMLKELLEKKVPQSWYRGKRKMPPAINTNKQLLSTFYKEEPAMKKSLEELTKEREKRKLKIELIDEEIKQQRELQGVLQEEKEKLQRAVSTVMDKWIDRAHDEGEFINTDKEGKNFRGYAYFCDSLSSGL